MEFIEFPKIPRLSRECVITEKIDGTNAQICITPEGAMWVGSRSRWITPADDNYGFARWAYDNKDELMRLGVGSHFGEWWGSGIQRNYGLKEKRFSLFNVHRWADPLARPRCCDIVPILFTGEFNTHTIIEILDVLKAGGSKAAPGFMNPEGVVIYHTASKQLFKKTILKDEEWKGKK